MTYIYYFNYQENEISLCQLEFKTLFNQAMTSNLFITEIDFDYKRSVYMKGRLKVLYQENDLNTLVELMNQDEIIYYDFKAQYIKNDVTHVDYQETLEATRMICGPIKGSVNFKEPKVIIGLTKVEDTWYVGEYESDTSWGERIHKPHSYSHSLNTRDARTLVNLAVKNDINLTLVDPCCGIGTVVLEALSMGIKTKGYDINRWVSYQARLNLEHYGFDPLVVEKVDMTTLDQHFDTCVLDIPYGVYSPFTYDQQLSLIQSTKHFTNRLVLVSHIDMQKELESFGYTIEDYTTITKGNFTRYITIANL